MTAESFRVYLAVLMALGTMGIILATAHGTTASQAGVVLACRDARGMVVARYTTRSVATLDGELELSIPRGETIRARCSIQ